ncbi:hypothetical protein FPHYL_7616 [Fusarium phyllophilum]|uniref:Uncharacterized protein n=1 Tax=Fusarium phyllophilum TaxID=47803 RepID=A0A8H5NAB5_9HYPO|nr:hypothetical protein FPHYL_7616 [Fusarium phyllophilum]
MLGWPAGLYHPDYDLYLELNNLDPADDSKRTWGILALIFREIYPVTNNDVRGSEQAITAFGKVFDLESDDDIGYKHARNADGHMVVYESKLKGIDRVRFQFCIVDEAHDANRVTDAVNNLLRQFSSDSPIWVTGPRRKHRVQT